MTTVLLSNEDPRFDASHHDNEKGEFGTNANSQCPRSNSSHRYFSTRKSCAIGASRLTTCTRTIHRTALRGVVWRLIDPTYEEVSWPLSRPNQFSLFLSTAD